MNELLPDNQRQHQTDPSVVYRVIGLFVLAVISGSLVFLFHQVVWPWFQVWFVVGTFAGIIVGGVLGVPLNSTMAMMLVMAGLLEGVYQGWQTYGLIGAILGGPAGVLLAVVLVMLTLMSMSAVVILFGGNPFVDGIPIESSGGEQKP